MYIFIIYIYVIILLFLYLLIKCSALGLERKICSTGGVCGSLLVLYRFGCRTKVSMPKWNPEGTRSNQNWTKRGAKTSQGTFKDTLAENSWKNIEKGCQKTQTRVPLFRTKALNTQKILTKNHSKNNDGKTWKEIPKWCQKGTKNHRFFKFWGKEYLSATVSFTSVERNILRIRDPTIYEKSTKTEN